MKVFPHSLSLNEQDEKRLDRLKKDGFKLVQIFRKGIEAIEKLTRDVDKKEKE